MTEPTISDHPHAMPLTNSGVEMATGSIKIVVARAGSFRIAGANRTAFVVGSRMSPVAVTYSNDANCAEWAVPPWMAHALLNVTGGDLGEAVLDLADLPRSPFRDVLMAGGPDPLSIARVALANWSAGRGTADARLAGAVWSALQRDPSRPMTAIAAKLDVGTRRVRQAVRRETSLSTRAIRRLMRHERAVAVIGNPDVTLAQAAQDAGYADQSHMTREMMALGGITPSRLRASILADRQDAQPVPVGSRQDRSDARS